MLIGLVVLGLVACEQDCREGYGKAADGVCYPLAGYTEGDGGAGDGGLEDGGLEDGGLEDGGAGDGGVEDGGAGDGGAQDGGAPDGGSPDGGSPDGGSPDGGSPDGGATGPTIKVEGSLLYDSSIEGSATCSIWMWAEEAIDPSTGFPDRPTYSDMGFFDVACPTTAGVAAPYTAEFVLSEAQTVYFFASLDQDGDLLTVTDRAEAGSEAGAIAVEPKGAYDGVDFELLPLPE